MEDIRAAIHRARCRIEGDDYQENPTGEPYVKWHRPLTSALKGLSVPLGADVPSRLPPEQRGAFIRECDRLQVLPDGTIGVKEGF